MARHIHLIMTIRYFILYLYLYTYMYTIGGHVECLEAGVFRADIPTKFRLTPSALQQVRPCLYSTSLSHDTTLCKHAPYTTLTSNLQHYLTKSSSLQQLIDRIDRDLTFALETEHDIQRTDVSYSYQCDYTA